MNDQRKTETVWCERCKKNHEVDVTPVPADHPILNAMPWLRNSPPAVQRTYANALDHGMNEITEKEDRLWHQQVERALKAQR